MQSRRGGASDKMTFTGERTIAQDGLGSHIRPYSLNRTVRPGRGPVCGWGVGVGSLASLAGYSVPVCIPPGFLVLRALRIHSDARTAGDAQWPGPLPVAEKQAGHMALAAPSQRRGHGPDHSRHRPPARVRGLSLPGLLPGPGAVRRDLPLTVARAGLDDYDRRRLYPRMSDGRSRPGSRCRR